MSIGYIEGAASLCMAAALDNLGRGEPLLTLPTREPVKRPEKSESLKRLLRKAKR